MDDSHVHDESGIYTGLNPPEHRLVPLSRNDWPRVPNGLILGKPGTGKAFHLGREMRIEPPIHFIDVKQEYDDLIRAYADSKNAAATPNPFRLENGSHDEKDR